MSSVRPYGIEWLVDAHGCEPPRLQSVAGLKRLFETLVRELDLHPIGPASWHRFPVTRGVTGLWMLKESHLACHSFPEYASICVNLFCCRPRAAWPWEPRLRQLLGAESVSVRCFRREYAGVLVS